MNCLNKITKTTLSLFVLSLIVAPAVFAANLIVNGDFSNGLTSWQTYSNGSVNYSNNNGAAEINVTSAGGNNQMYQTGFLLKANTQYTLSFDAKSTSGGTNINAVVHRHSGNPNYASYGLSENVSLTNQMQNYSYTFTSNNTSDENDTRLRFSFDSSANGGVITIDNIVVEEGSTGGGGGGTTYDTYDFNEDGSVDLGDLVEIIKYVFGG